MAFVPKEYYDLPEAFRNPLKKKGFSFLEILTLYGIVKTYPTVYLKALSPKTTVEISPLTITTNAPINPKGCYSAAIPLENRGYLTRIYRPSGGSTRSEVRYVINHPLLLDLLEEIKSSEIK